MLQTRIFMGQPVRGGGIATNIPVPAPLRAGELISSEGKILEQEGTVFGIAGFHSFTGPDGQIYQTVWLHGEVCSTTQDQVTTNINPVFPYPPKAYLYDKEGVLKTTPNCIVSKL